MKTVYVKTTWVDNQTPVNAANLNKIEGAIEDLYTRSLSASNIVGINGVEVNTTEEGNIEVSTMVSVMKSNTCTGVELINYTPDVFEVNKLYFITDIGGRLVKAMFNGSILF